MKVSKGEAATACHEQAWVDEKEPIYIPVRGLIDGEQLYRKVSPPSEAFIHCLIGSFGATWSLEAALARIDLADSIEWVDHFDGHDLKVVSEGTTYCFDVSPDASH